MFTVGDLKAQLANLPDDAVLVISEDDEGNSFWYMSGVDFEPTGEWSSFYDTEAKRVYTRQDLDYLERDPAEPTLQHCAVAY